MTLQPIILPNVAPPNELGARIAAVLHNAGFAGNDLVTAVAVAKAESGWKYDATHKNANGSTDYGLMQINSVHNPSPEQQQNPVANAKLAFQIYSRAGRSFKPWATFTSGAYKKNVAEARQAIADLKKRGPAWERATVKSLNTSKATMFDNSAQSQNSTDITGAVNAVPNAIMSAVNAVTSQIAKVGGNALAITVAVVLLILGIVILLRQSAVSGAVDVVKKAL